MRKPRTLLILVLAVTLFTSTFPAAASHPQVISVVAPGQGRMSNWPLTSSILGGSPGSQKVEAMSADWCAGNQVIPDLTPPLSTHPLKACQLFLADIELAPINGVGPSCEGFAGSGGWGYYRDESLNSIELSDIQIEATPGARYLLADAYIVVVHGTHAHDGVTRPFVGEMVWHTQSCGTEHTGGHRHLNGAFSFTGHITLL